MRVSRNPCERHCFPRPPYWQPRRGAFYGLSVPVTRHEYTELSLSAHCQAVAAWTPHSRRTFQTSSPALDFVGRARRCSSTPTKVPNLGLRCRLMIMFSEGSILRPVDQICTARIEFKNTAHACYGGKISTALHDTLLTRCTTCLCQRTVSSQ